MDYRAWGTVGHAIDFVRGFYPDWNAARCEELQFSFGVHRDARVDALSFGARMKLALLLSLSRDAELLVLDEPTLGLDAIARRQLFAELLKFMTGEGRTILISSHQLTDLERFADHAAIVNQGKLLTSGRMDKLVERYRQIDARIVSDAPLGITGVSVIDRQGDRVRLLVDGDLAAAEVAGCCDAGVGFSSEPRVAHRGPGFQRGRHIRAHHHRIPGAAAGTRERASSGEVFRAMVSPGPTNSIARLYRNHQRELQRRVYGLLVVSVGVDRRGSRDVLLRLLHSRVSTAGRHSPLQQRECFFAGLRITPSLSQEPQQVLHDEQHMVRIARAWLEIKMLIKPLGIIVLGVNEQRPRADQVRRLRHP